MNIHPAVILYYLTKLSYSCKYVVPGIQIEPGWRPLSLSHKKNRKLTKTDIGVYVESMRICGEKDI